MRTDLVASPTEDAARPLDPASPAGPPIVTPVREGERIAVLDVARGAALLGILLVNMQFFAYPLGQLFAGAPDGASQADLAIYYVVKIFAEGKFFPLFSLLFGMGIALQMARAQATGRPFGAAMARRLVLLGVIGAAHAIFLWFGDILFLYAWLGGILTLFAAARARTLIVAGIVMMVFAGVMTGLLGFVSPKPADLAPTASSTPADPAEADGSAVAPDQRPFVQLMALMQREGAAPWSEEWMALETQAYRSGPYADATAFRVISWGIYLLVSLVSVGWTALGMFFLGAGLMRTGIFDPSMLHWHRRFVLLALVVGLPGTVAGTVAAETLGAGEALDALATAVTGPVISLGYLGALTLLVTGGRLPRASAAFASAGRMALTCYLLETLLVTCVVYHWGLGLFGALSRVEQLILALAVYAAIVAFSVIWFRHFTIGPLEYLWRAVTYLRLLPVVRR